MADILCTDDFLRIADVFCGPTRTTMLALEPGSRVWIAVEGEPMLFERMQDDAEGRSVRGLKPVDAMMERWQGLRDEFGPMLEIDFVERPADEGRGIDRVGRVGGEDIDAAMMLLERRA